MNYTSQVVLVKPLYPRNIGAVSRAMANMGVHKLILIAPQCEIDFEAQQAAATGQEALRAREVFTSWQQYNLKYPHTTRLAFTARDGQNRIVQPLLEVLRDLKSQDTKVGLDLSLVFGPEDWGLANEDIQNCHLSVAIPTFGDNPSLNLAQAVLLALYSMRLTLGGQEYAYQQRAEQSEWVEGSGDEWFPDKSFIKFLEAMRFDLGERRVSSYTTLRQMLLRTRPTVKELRLLTIIFEQAARKISKHQD